MNGADVLIRALADAGVEVCFANPGTSEMQLVGAIDGEPRMRAILGLFEGVVREPPTVTDVWLTNLP